MVNQGAAKDQSVQTVPSSTNASSPFTAWDKLSFGVAHVFVSAVTRLVGIRGLYFFGRGFGTLEWMINYKRRRRFARAYKKIAEANPSRSDLRRTSREFFCRSRCDKLFYLILDSIPKDKLRTHFVIDNKEMLDESLARGKGVYLAVSHHGAHHVTAMLLAIYGYRVALVRDGQESGLRKFVQDRFERLHPELPRLQVIFADAYPRDIYRCFKDGYILGSAMDVSRVRQAHQQFEEVTIFGERRKFLSGPLKIASRCGGKAIQVFLTCEPNFRYRLDVAQQLLDATHGSDKDENITAAMQLYATNVEKHVRRHPQELTRI